MVSHALHNIYFDYTVLTYFDSETCIKGHRSSTCNHTDRPLFEIKKKGRPVTQCEHCRELRKTKQVHVKCLCEGRDDAEGPSVSHSIPAKKGMCCEASARVCGLHLPNSKQKEHGGECGFPRRIKARLRCARNLRRPSLCREGGSEKFANRLQCSLLRHGLADTTLCIH